MFRTLFQADFRHDSLMDEISLVQYSHNSSKPLRDFENGVIPNYSCKVTRLQTWMSALWRLHKRNCRIGKLRIKTSVFVQKREYLKIWLIVCICSAHFGHRTTSIKFLRWHCIYYKKPAKQDIIFIVIQLYANCYIFSSLLWLWNCFSHQPLYYHRNTSKRISHSSEH